MGLGKKFAIIISLKDTSYPPLVPSVELVRGCTPLTPSNSNADSRLRRTARLEHSKEYSQNFIIILACNTTWR